MEIEIARMTQEDLPEVLEIERRCFVSPWSRGFFLQEIGSEFSHPFVARPPASDGKGPGPLVGYLCLWVVYDELHVQNIAVHPDWRRRGIATRLVEHGIVVGRHRGAKTAVLEVRRSNVEALALYEKFGFQVVGVRRNYYVEEREDALVMLAVIEEPEERGVLSALRRRRR